MNLTHDPTSTFNNFDSPSLFNTAYFLIGATSLLLSKIGKSDYLTVQAGHGLRTRRAHGMIPLLLLAAMAYGETLIGVLFQDKHGFKHLVNVLICSNFDTVWGSARQRSLTKMTAI